MNVNGSSATKARIEQGSTTRGLCPRKPKWAEKYGSYHMQMVR